MVAFGLACAHAARGDGRTGSIATFSGKAGSGSSRVATFTAARGGGSTSVITTHGDAVAPTNSKRTTTNDTAVALDRASVVARRNAAAGGVSVPGGAVAGRPGKSAKPSPLLATGRGAPAIEVRKVAVMSDGSEVVEPRRVAMVAPSSDAALDAELRKLSSPPTRNAFALPGLPASSGKTTR